jgi:hypothetical protein
MDKHFRKFVTNDAKPCITCDKEHHCSRNCTAEMEIVKKKMAMEDATYTEALARFIAGMPF